MFNVRNIKKSLSEGRQLLVDKMHVVQASAPKLSVVGEAYMSVTLMLERQRYEDPRGQEVKPKFGGQVQQEFLFQKQNVGWDRRSHPMSVFGFHKQMHSQVNPHMQVYVARTHAQTHDSCPKLIFPGKQTRELLERDLAPVIPARCKREMRQN